MPLIVAQAADRQEAVQVIQGMGPAAAVTPLEPRVHSAGQRCDAVGSEAGCVGGWPVVWPREDAK